jgi:hypothetical protein
MDKSIGTEPGYFFPNRQGHLFSSAKHAALSIANEQVSLYSF